MSASTTMGRASIQPRDLSASLRAHGLVGTALAGLEWQRKCQADVEVEWLMKHTGVTPKAGASVISPLRQAIGAALVRAGERLAGVPRSGVASDPVPAADRLRMAG